MSSVVLAKWLLLSCVWDVPPTSWCCGWGPNGSGHTEGSEGCRAQHGCYRGINLLGWERGMFLLGGWLSLQYYQEEVAESIIDTGGLGRQWVWQVCTFVCLGWRLALGLISCEACCCSVTQSCLTLCDPQGLQHTGLPCPSPSPGVCSNSCPLSQWCLPTISSSVVPFSSCLQSFPRSRSLPVSQFFASGGQSIGASASASVLPMNIQNWFPLGWTGWISLQSKGLSRVFSNTPVQKHQFFGAQLSLWFNSHICTWLLEKP